MELHSQALNFLCRLCGEKLSKYSHNKYDLKRKIEKVCDIDVSNDATSLHPPQVCDKCRRQLDRKYKEKQVHKEIKNNPFKPLQWTAHSTQCQICPTVSQQGIDENSYIEKCSDIFNLHGYVRIHSQDGVLIHCVKLMPDAEKLFSSIKIFTDKTFSVHVLGKLICNETIIEESKLSSPDSLRKILNYIDTTPICKGNTGFEDLAQSSCVLESGGQPVAYVETGYGRGTTVRHRDCRLFLHEQTNGLCHVCTIFRSNLFKKRRRMSDSCTIGVPTRKRPNSSLSNTEMMQKLKTMAKEKKAIKRRLESSSSMLSKEIQKNGILLDECTSASFRAVAEKNASDIASAFPAGSPQQLLSDQQMEVLQSTSKHAVRWHPAFLRWCISLYGKSPSAYRMVRGSKFLVLPHETTLMDYTNFLKVRPGVNVDILKDIVRQTEYKCENDNFRNNVSLVFDEIKIKSNLVYSKSSGKLKGFIECGDINDIINDFVKSKSEETDEDLATHVVAFMVRGIFTSLKQVFAYYPCKGFTSYQLYWSVWGAVAALEDSGFRVRALVSDGASPNRKFYRLHDIVGQANLPTFYTVNLHAADRRLYFVCDVPHLMKTTRNNLENSNWNKKSRRLKLNGEPMEWTQLIELLTLDLRGEGLRLVPRLTYEHLYLNPSLRMRVKLATQVLSNSVSKALTVLGQQNVTQLSKFIRTMDRFFDCLNVSTVSQGNRNPTKQPYRTTEDWRLKWLEEDFLQFISSWENDCLAEPGLTMAERRRMCLSRETLEGLRITAMSFVSITKELLRIDGVEYILSEKFSQDPIEEFFGRVRAFHGHHTHPTVGQFESALAHISALKGQDMHVSRRGNITQDNDGMQLNNTPLQRRRGR